MTRSRIPVVLTATVLAFLFASSLPLSARGPQSVMAKPVAGSPQRPATEPGSATPREAALIERTGLREFAPENNVIDTSSPLEKQLAGALLPVMELVGDFAQVEKNRKALVALNGVIEKSPPLADLQFFRATLAILTESKENAPISSDIDNAIRLFRSSAVKGIYDLVDMYALRAKVDLLAGNSVQAIKDLDLVVTSEPDNAEKAFNTGGVKPEDASNPTALHKRDLDLLVMQFPNDYRTYMFRGMFYFGFTSFGEQFFAPAIEDLQRAARLAPQSALVRYFLGRTVEKMTFLTAAAWADLSDETGARGGYREKTREVALRYFKEAATLDSRFADAQAHVANSLYGLKRYPEAISAYDKVIALEPENAGAYNDRGLAKTYSGNPYGAISDFSKAIEIKSVKVGERDTLGSSFENRAAAYVKIGQFDAAIEDYSRAIGFEFAAQVFLMPVAEIRAMYPEFANITDRDLVEGLRQKYFPQMDADGFAKHYGEIEKPWQEFVLGGVYVSRGDAYLRALRFRKAASEYARANQLFSHAMDDRWRVVSSSANSEYAIDTQTLDFSQGNLVTLWLKTTESKSQAYYQQSFQIDCGGRRVRILSSLRYDANGQVVGSSAEGAWQRVAPETIGEMLHSGMCK